MDNASLLNIKDYNYISKNINKNINKNMNKNTNKNTNTNTNTNKNTNTNTNTNMNKNINYKKLNCDCSYNSLEECIICFEHILNTDEYYFCKNCFRLYKHLITC